MINDRFSKAQHKSVTAAFAAVSFFLFSPSKAETVHLGVGSGALTTNGWLVSAQFTSHTGLLSDILTPVRLFARIEWSVFGARGKGTDSNDLGVFGVSPVLRYFSEHRSLFIEAGLGAYQFSKHMLNRDDGVGTSFEFGSFLGLGAMLGPVRKVEVGYRILHFSNAGMSSFNPGVNFYQVRIGYRY